MSISLPDLPFKPDAFEPDISKKTFEYHHGKHHKAYVDKTNELIKGTDLEDCSLEVIIMRAHRDQNKKLFNQAAQAWNHTFFWNSIAPDPDDLSGALADDIESSFGSLDDFREEFVKAGTNLFGNGWVWLTRDGGDLRIRATQNAETPVVMGETPLLTVDIWEHAYYLDYQNERKSFLKTVAGKHLNWQFATSNYQADVDHRGS